MKTGPNSGDVRAIREGDHISISPVLNDGLGRSTTAPTLVGHVGGPHLKQEWVVASVGNGKIGLSWGDVQDAFTINGYRVRHQVHGATSWTDSAVLSTSTHTYTLTGLDPTKAYDVVIQARNDGGTEHGNLWSFGAHIPPITPDARDAGTPEEVSTPTVTAGSTQLEVDWAPVEVDSGAAVHYYTVRYKVSTANDSTYVSKIAPERAPSKATLTGLTACTEYTVQVRAHNVNGESDWVTVKGTPTVTADLKMTR